MIFTAIIWTAAFIVGVIQCISGGTPNWAQVFCPLIATLGYAWEKVIEE